MVLRTHTFMFADLCGYTEYSWIHGDEASADLAVTFHELARRLTREEGCDFIKTIGDAVMIRADDAVGAVCLARRLRRTVNASDLLPIRIGLDTGSAVPRGGDWYGTAVNTAARVCKQADADEMWMTERVLAAVREELALDVRSQGTHPLKGLPECTLHSIQEGIVVTPRATQGLRVEGP
jgi:adenylate cyclase